MSFPNTILSEASHMTKEVDDKVDNVLIGILEQKLKAATLESEQEKAKRMALEVDVKSMIKNMGEMKRHKELVDAQVIRERELKRVFEKEVTKLKEKIASQKILILNLEEQTKNLKGDLSGVFKTKNANIHGLASEKTSLAEKVKQYEQEIEEKDEIIDDMRYKLQAKEELQNRVEEERRKQLRNMNLEVTEENAKKMYKITKLVGELADLTQKFSESEYMRKKYIEKNKDLEKRGAELHQMLSDATEEIARVKKEARSLRKARTTNNKVLDKRMNEMQTKLQLKTAEVKRLEAEVEELKKVGKPSDFDNFEQKISGIEVNAKPTLFGAYSDSED